MGGEKVGMEKEGVKVSLFLLLGIFLFSGVLGIIYKINKKGVKWVVCYVSFILVKLL